MKYLEYIVKNMKISKSQTDKAVLISGATDYFGMHFTYDEEFASLEEVKTCEFFKNRKTVKVDLVDGYCAVPNEILRDKNPFEMRVVSGNTVGTPWFAVAITEGGIISNDDEPEELAPMGTAYVKTLTGENNISMIRDNDGAFEYSKDGQNWKTVNPATTDNENSGSVETPIISDEQINERIESYLSDNDYATNADIENKIDKTVATKIEKAVNSISNPFETAYWRDSSDGQIYLVTISNGVLNITKQGQDETAPDDNTESETPNNPSVELEGLLEDRLLIWHDEFDGDTLNTDNWEYEIGYYRNDEPQYYKAENVAVAGSICKITAKKETVTDDEAGKTYNWTSGSIQTLGKKMFRRGRLEAKIRFSNIGGEWGAFWTLGFGAPWSMNGEIDICETWGTKQNKATFNMHYIDMGGARKNAGLLEYNVNVSEWNIFAAEIDDNNVTIYINGTQICLLKHSDFNFWQTRSYQGSALNPFKTLQKYIKLNLALQPEDSNNYPQGSEDRTMEIDWVRLYAPLDKTEIPETTEVYFLFPGYLWSSSQEDITIDFSDLPNLKKYNDMYYIPTNVWGNDNDSVLGYTFTSDNPDVLRFGLDNNSGGISGMHIRGNGEAIITATTTDGLTYSHKFIVKNFS